MTFLSDILNVNEGASADHLNISLSFKESFISVGAQGIELVKTLV